MPKGPVVVLKFVHMYLEVQGRNLMKKAMIVVASMAFSGAAVAEGPAWTYVDGGLIFTDSAGEDTSTGGAITGSFGFDLFHVNARYLDVSDVATDVDFSAARIGAGIHPAITDSTDLVVEIGYTDAEIDLPSGTGFSDPEPSGVDLQFGVRSMLADNLELNATVLFFYGDTDTPGDDDLQETGLRIGGQYFFTDNFSVNASATQGWLADNGNLESGDSIQVGGRFSF